MSAFFLALVDLAALEIRLLFLDFVDYVALCFSSLIPLSSTLYVSYSTYLASLT